MPGLRHSLLARALPVLRGGSEVHDADAFGREKLAEQEAADTEPPHWLAKRLDVTEVGGMGFPVHSLVPRGATPTRSVLYLHGGGYISHADKAHWRWVMRLAERLGARILFPVYPLAPTYTWRDAYPPLRDLFEQIAVGSPGGVTVMGDSAGGGLALGLAQQIAAGTGPQPTHVVLISPWVDVTAASVGTDEASDRDPWLKMTRLKLAGAWWSGADDPRRSEVSPLYGDLAGLPPGLMFCGTRDTMHPQCRELADRARAAEWDLTYVEETDLLHVYPILPVREAKRAFEQTVDFLAPGS